MIRTKKFDSTPAGLIAGILVPVLTLLVLWLVSSDISLWDYLNSFYRLKSLAGLLSLCTIPNLLLFFIAIWTNRNRSARGVIIATFILAALMLIFKFV